MRDPQWLDGDVEWALETQRWLDSLCPGCGNPRDECMDPELEGAYEAEAVRCHACTAREAAAAKAAERKPDRSVGRLISVRLSPEADEWVQQRRRGTDG